MRKNTQTETAIFAGGCFWSIEESMRQARGWIATETGYTGGRTENPTFETVSRGRTGHTEAVRVVFDPRVVSFEELAKLFFEIHDPTQVNRQGPDVGKQFRSEIFYTSPTQLDTAQRLIGGLRKRGWRVATRLSPALAWHRAEDIHQQFSERSGRKLANVRVKRF